MEKSPYPDLQHGKLNLERRRETHYTDQKSPSRKAKQYRSQSVESKKNQQHEGVSGNSSHRNNFRISNQNTSIGNERKTNKESKLSENIKHNMPYETDNARSRSRSYSHSRMDQFHDTQQNRSTHLSKREEARIFQESPFSQRKIIDMDVGDRQQWISSMRQDGIIPRTGRVHDSQTNLEDQPPHLRHFLKNCKAQPEIPPRLDEQLRFEHQINIEAQRDILLRRGFPTSHPMVSGEINIHPELMGHLQFDLGQNKKTMPLGDEDFFRFLPDMHRHGMQSSFPISTSDLLLLSEREEENKNRGHRRGWRDEVLSRNIFGGSKKREMQLQSQKQKKSVKPRPHSMFVETSQINNKKSSNDISDDVSFNIFPTRTDSGIGDDLGKRPTIRNETNTNSSFGMILKDRFQTNPNMYFPDTVKSKQTSTPLRSWISQPSIHDKQSDHYDDWSDTETLVNKMSDKDSGLSGEHSSESGGSNQSPELSLQNTSARSITTPKYPSDSSVLLPSNPSVILNKKTLRNYNPRESQNMLRKFEESWQPYKFYKHQIIHSSNEIEKTYRPEPLNHIRDSSLGTRTQTNTGTSNMSYLSAASSAASFDYHAASSFEHKNSSSSPLKNLTSKKTMSTSNLPSLTEVNYGSTKYIPHGDRDPPDGASLDNVNKNHVKTISKVSQSVDHLLESNIMTPNKAAGTSKELTQISSDDDDLSALKKLLSEGRIAGLSDKPPKFKPPSPPGCRLLPDISAKNNIHNLKGIDINHEKQNIPIKTSNTKSADKVKKVKSPNNKKLAPKPPNDEIKPPEIQTPEVQFISGRRIHSVENINHSDKDQYGRQKTKSKNAPGVKRSTSMHIEKEREEKVKSEKDSVAKLVEDSTERKFKISSLFKGIWKKKQYSFDLG